MFLGAAHHVRWWRVSASEGFTVADAERMAAVIHEVVAERGRQQSKWGRQDHDPFVYGAILTEEIGEAMRSALRVRFEDKDRISDVRGELIQVAAVAVAAIECLDRGEWVWGGHFCSAKEPGPRATSIPKVTTT